MRRRTSLALAGVSTVAALALASPAAASDVSVSGGSVNSLSVSDGVSPMNLTISYDPATARVRFEEPGISTSAPSVCVDEGDAVSCVPPAPVPGIDVRQAAGRISVRGTSANDRIVAASLPASLAISVRSAEGADALSGGAGPDNFDPGPGADQITGGGGVDAVTYGQRVTPLLVALNGSPVSGNELDGPAGARDTLATDVEIVSGGNAADTFVGNGGANIFYGYKGNDALLGGAGIDQLFGGADADRLVGGPGADLLVGELGVNDRMLGGKGIDKLIASDGRPDKIIDCGPGNDRRERVKTDRGDPPPKSC